MTRDEFRHDVVIPIQTVEKHMMFRIIGYPEYNDIKLLFELLNKKLSKFIFEIEEEREIPQKQILDMIREVPGG